MPFHEVQPGDYLASIAKRFGLSDWRVIWDHPQNAELRTLRKDPNVLLAGDRVFVPEHEARSEDAATEQRHAFRTGKRRLELRLDLRDAYGQPLADCEGELDVEGVTHAVRTDSAGRLAHAIPLDARVARLRLGDRLWDLRIGDLDPVSEPSGWHQRLGNLGYPAGRGGGAQDVELRLAIEEFQCDHGLAVDGVCGPLTQAKLAEVHGA